MVDSFEISPPRFAALPVALLPIPLFNIGFSYERMLAGCVLKARRLFQGASMRRASC
jgi:hypothetical protein